MDLTLIKLSLERLFQRVEKLESENRELKEQLTAIENKPVLNVPVDEIKQESEDILIDTKEVLKMLGISYNTLRTIVQKKWIVPVRINQRRVRYSKKAIREYIKSRSY